MLGKTNTTPEQNFIKLLNEEITLTANGTYTPAEGFTGFNPVHVKVPSDIVNRKIDITENGQYIPEEPYTGFNVVNVNVNNVKNQSKVITENGIYLPAPEFTGFDKVEVNVPPEGDTIIAISKDNVVFNQGDKVLLNPSDLFNEGIYNTEYVITEVNINYFNSEVLTGFIKNTLPEDVFGNSRAEVLTVLDKQKEPWSNIGKVYGFNMRINVADE